MYDGNQRNDADADSVDHVEAGIRPTAWRAHQEYQDMMKSSNSAPDITCEILDGIPYFGGRRGGYECTNSRERDDHHPDITNENDVDDLDEESYDGVLDTRKYASSRHCHDRHIAVEFDGSALVQDLLRLEHRVAELESQLYLHQKARRESTHEDKDDTFSVRSLQQQQSSLQQVNTTLMRKLVSMNDELITERNNSMKSQVLLKDEIDALKLELDGKTKRNDSLQMFRKSDKVVENKKKSLKGKLVCPFPMDGERLLRDGERQPRHMSSESIGSSSNVETAESFDLVKMLRSAIMQPAESVLNSNDTRRILMDSNEVYVPFPKERRRVVTIDGAPLSSKRTGLLDVVQTFLPRRRGDNGRRRDNNDSTNKFNLNADDHLLFPSERPDKGPGIFALYSLRKSEQERVEPHESWAPADEINTQTELFNAKSMAKVERSYRLHSSSTSCTTHTTSESTQNVERD